MKLKTNCKGCTFQTPLEVDGQPICNAGKNIVAEEGQLFADGFCNHKRTNGKSFDEVVEEEKKLTIVLLAKDVKHCRIIDFVNTVCNHCDQIVISCFNGSPTHLEKIVKTLRSRSVQWNIDNAYVDPDIEYQDHTIVDAVVKYVKNHWFIVLTPQDVLKAHSITKLKEILKNNDSNNVCYYFDDLRVMTSKAAFEQLKGNQQKPYLEKLKEFDNWESKCIKME